MKTAKKITITFGVILVAISIVSLTLAAQSLIPDRKESLQKQIERSGDNYTLQVNLVESLSQQLQAAEALKASMLDSHEILVCEMMHLKLADNEKVSEETKAKCLGKSTGVSQ